MTTATENQTSEHRLKRVRFEPGQTTGIFTPTQEADLTSNTIFASLPEPITTLARPAYELNMKHNKEALNFANNKLRFAKADYQPTSTRVNFTVGATKRVKNNTFSKTTLNTLIEECQTINAEFAAKQKAVILKSVDLELESLHAEMLDEFTTFTMALAKVLLICEKNPLSETDLLRHAVELNHLTIKEHHATILVHIPQNQADFLSLDATTFYQRFHEVNNLAVIHKYNPDKYTAEAPFESRALVPKFKEIIEGLFARPWTNYMTKKDKQRRETEASKFAHLTITEKATADTADLMDLDTVNQQQVSDMIDARFAAGLKAEKKKKEKSERGRSKSDSRSSDKKSRSVSPTPKKGNRGANTTSASSKKKNVVVEKRNAKAVASNNASGKGKSRSPKGKQNTKSQDSRGKGAKSTTK
jgi:hypothetical protein